MHPEERRFLPSRWGQSLLALLLGLWMAGAFLTTLQSPANQYSGRNPINNALAATTTDLYLPVINHSLKISLSETFRGVNCPYCYCRVVAAYGLLANQTTYPLTATVSIPATVYPYCPGMICQPYDVVLTATIAFSQILPGMPTGYEHETYVCRSDIVYHQPFVDRIHTIAPEDATARPLTIVDWTIQGDTLTGTVRNDSGFPLGDLRVVAFFGSCGTFNLPGMGTILLPSETAVFSSTSPYFSYCEEDPIIAGQGVVDGSPDT